MKTLSIDREIRSRIDAFLSELTALIKGAALDAVTSALGASGPAAAPAAVSAAAPRAAAAPKRRGKRGKRTSEQVNADTANLLAYIQAHPAQRLEQIGKGMQRPTKELKLPIQKLLDHGQLHTEGRRRGMKYSAGAAKRRARAKKA